MLGKIKAYLSQPALWASRLVFLLGPLLCLVMVEALNESDITTLSPLQIALNLAWYFCLFVLVRIIAGKNRRAGAISAALCFAVGLLNHYVLRIRGRVLWPTDLSSWRTALNVAGTQDYSIDLFIVLGAMVLVVYLILIALCPPRPKGRDRLRKRSIAGGLAAVLSYVAVFFCTGTMPALGMYPHQWNTRLNGFALNFTLAARSMSFSEPDGYDQGRVLELSKEYPGTAGEADKQPENIIVVMCESFADFSIYDNFSASQDPTPFLHSMAGRENTITGTILSPVETGGTATVEHSFLTGLCSMFMPVGSVAYQLYLHEDTPSMAEVANAVGYETIAFHPYLSSGWNRVQVYNYMGFDQQLYQEDVQNPVYVRDYISDSTDYRELARLTEEHDGKTFIFNVTMQNHNGYDQEWTNLERTIHLPDELTTLEPNAEQYFSSLRESDRALGELISYYQECEESTLIVFFGDHQPPLSTELYTYLLGGEFSSLTAEEWLPIYKTPFMIWANYDIEETEGCLTTPAGLGAYTAKLTGLPMTGLQQFVLDFQEMFPGAFPLGLVLPDGEVVTGMEGLEEAEQQAYQDYEMLTYSGLMDQFEGTEPLFHPVVGKARSSP